MGAVNKKHYTRRVLHKIKGKDNFKKFISGNKDKGSKNHMYLQGKISEV